MRSSKTLLASLVKNVETRNDKPLIAAILDVTPEELKTIADEILQSPQNSCVVVLGAKSPRQMPASSYASATTWWQRESTARHSSKSIAPIIEGTGGGKPNSAQAGGKAPHEACKRLSIKSGSSYKPCLSIFLQSEHFRDLQSALQEGETLLIEELWNCP